MILFFLHVLVVTKEKFFLGSVSNIFSTKWYSIFIRELVVCVMSIRDISMAVMGRLKIIENWPSDMPS
ncbi:hypothetical protein D3C85_1708130 [compost metagenome]